MKQYYPVIFLCVAVYGIYYFVARKKILSRKFYDSEIPERAERTAKCVSIAMVIVGILGAAICFLNAS